MIRGDQKLLSGEERRWKGSCNERDFVLDVDLFVDSMVEPHLLITALMFDSTPCLIVDTTILCIHM
jgi:hypothetical protein